MSVVDRLASSQGLRTQEANSAVALECTARPELIPDIVGGLTAGSNLLAGDCAEVMTKVAETRPDLVAPHAEALCALLGHTNGRVRWESAHALALIAPFVPEVIERELDAFRKIISADKSVIIRDYIIDAVGAYGRSERDAAERAFPILRETLAAWEGKHAARTLVALGRLAATHPALGGEVAGLARDFLTHARPGIRKAARAALKSAESARKTT
ncbi:hypothetical protein JXA88_09225 [Candidatus Fermentibacteria bacterium]|nr:hypothetical protein [Candidatus Fermentibacteria bacterium]